MLFTSGNGRVRGAGGVLVFGRQSLLTSWEEESRAGRGAGASAARGGPAVEARRRPRWAALAAAQQLVGHGGAERVQATSTVSERARGARVAAPHTGLLERVAGD